MRRRRGSQASLGSSSSAASVGGDEDEWAQWERARKQKQQAQDDAAAAQREGSAGSERGGRDRSDSGVASGTRCGPGLYAQGNYALEEEIGRGMGLSHSPLSRSFFNATPQA